MINNDNENFRALYARFRTVLREEGLVTVLRKGVALLRLYLRRYSRRYLIRYENVYLYKYSHADRAETDFLPSIDNLTVEIVPSISRATELAAKGIDIRQLTPYAESSLNKGAIAFCILVGNELAHIGWVATTEEAKNTFDDFPYHVDFSHGEACTGGTATLPKYRQRGLMVYGYIIRFQYLREMGYVTSRNAVTVNNIASQRAHARLNPTIYAKGRLLKIFGIQFWRVTCLGKDTSLS